MVIYAQKQENLSTDINHPFLDALEESCHTKESLFNLVASTNDVKKTSHIWNQNQGYAISKHGGLSSSVRTTLIL